MLCQWSETSTKISKTSLKQSWVSNQQRKLRKQSIFSAPPPLTKKALRLRIRKKHAESASAEFKLCFLSTSGWGPCPVYLSQNGLKRNPPMLSYQCPRRPSQWLELFGQYWPAARARELFEPPADSGSLLLSIEKKLCLGFSATDVTSRVFCVFFWPILPGPGRQPNGPFMAEVFLKSRLSSESLEPLIGILPYLEQNYCSITKMSKNSTTTNANSELVLLMDIL